jgi:hypothetical protein
VVTRMAVSEANRFAAVPEASIVEVDLGGT